MTTTRLSLRQARRLTLAAQGLDANHRCTDVTDVVRRLGCIQFDPLNVVARTQLLVLFSRLGSFDPDELDEAAFVSKDLFHYWAHAASIVLTEDYPIHAFRMRTWPGSGGWADRVLGWMASNDELRRSILRELKRKGPLLSRDLADRSTTAWSSSGWTEGQGLSRMLDFLWIQGLITIAGRVGTQRLWAHADKWFPEWTPRERLTEAEVNERVTLKGLRALGVATARHAAHHFVSTSHKEARAVLGNLLQEGVVKEVEVAGLKGKWYVHGEDLRLLDEVGTDWQGRTTVLSPFDNLIRDRERTAALFDLDFTIEIYVPKAKRRYGYYVLPVVDADRIVALIDPKMDRKNSRLTVAAIHAAPAIPPTTAVGKRVERAIRELATWLEATSIDYGEVPSVWRKIFS